MPKYKRRDPEYTAIQFTGSNIREILDELGPDFSTPHSLDLKDAETFGLTRTWPSKFRETRIVRRGRWIVVAHEVAEWFLKRDEDFRLEYETVKRGGRPPKERK